jgi:hypothetical protein
MPSSVRAVDAVLSLSVSKTTVSFTLQNSYVLHAGDTEYELHAGDTGETVPWRRLLSWALGCEVRQQQQQQQQQQQDGDTSPINDTSRQFAIRERLKPGTASGENERRLQVEGGELEGEASSASRDRSFSDSVDWTEDKTGSRVPSKTEWELSQLREEE